MINNKCDVSINYQGDVSFKYIVNGKVVSINNHNSASPDLFKILTKALAGYDIKSEIPVKIDLHGFSDGDEASVNLLNHSAYISGTRYYIDADSNWSVYYSTTIQRSNMTSFNINDYDNYKLSLKSVKSELATVSISSDLISSIQQGAQLIIDWRLFFTNSNFNENDIDSNPSVTHITGN